MENRLVKWRKGLYLLFCLMSLIPTVQARETVVLLHGLARSSGSMDRIGQRLEEAGYRVVNLSYPSTDFPVEELAVMVHEQVLRETPEAERIHFVTHSMGGILVRYIQANWPLQNLGRVVMLSPPNQGSEVVDKLGGFGLYQKINGPAGRQLGTDPATSIPLQLGAVDFELGIITGDRSINWILSSLIPGKDDGKVSIERARIQGMTAFKVVHATHPLIMYKKSVIADILSFLKSGTFND